MPDDVTVFEPPPTQCMIRGCVGVAANTYWNRDRTERIEVCDHHQLEEWFRD